MTSAPPRPPLTKERIVRAAVALADRNGLGVLTMRRLGTELGVEAMSLYKHVASKDEILDGMVETVIGEIELPGEETDWKQGMRRRALSAREVFRRHSWAIGLLEGRPSMGPKGLGYLDAIIGSLRSAGFSLENAAHAFWLLDSYVYGQVIHETAMSGSTSDRASQAGTSLGEVAMEDYPHLVELREHALRSKHSFEGEFEFGLDLILDSLAGRAPGPRRRTRPGGDR